MLLNKKPHKINTLTFGITPEEAKQIRRQKELDKIPNIINKFKRAKRNAKRREIKEKYKIENMKPDKKIKKLL